MTPTEMETVLQNLDARLLGVEQVLPTLATKHDLSSEIEHLAAQLRGDIERSANGLRVLIEDSRSDNQLLAEHVLEILNRLRGEP